MQKTRRINHYSTFRHSHSETQFYREDVWLEAGRMPLLHTNMLHLFGYGESLFKPGAEIPIQHSYWAVQWVHDGRGILHYKGMRHNLRPDDLFVVPPNTPYTFRIPKDSILKKKYLVINNGPLISLLCNHGPLNRKEILRLRDTSGCAEIFHQIKGVAAGNMENQTQQLSNLSYMLFSELTLQQGRNEITGEFESKLEYVLSNPGSNYSLDELAEQFQVGKRSLNRLFRKNLGQTPAQYFIKMKLEYAAHLLNVSNFTIQAVASECGYNDTAFFSREFKKHYGVSPRSYRKQLPVIPAGS